MKEIPPRVRLALLRVATLPFDRLAPLALPPEAMAAWQQVLDLEAALLKEMDPLSDALHAAAGEPTGGGPPEAARGRLAVIHLRRALHNRRPVAARLLAEAGAALPPELAEGVLGHLQRRAELAALETGAVGAHQAGLLAARRALLDLVRLPLFREAVRLVSRSLLERLETLERRDPGRWRHDERHAAAKLTAYAARFATKTSPNSLFCATALAWVGGDEARLVGENHLHRLEILLSVAEARKVSACLGTDPAAWPAVVPRVNPTLRPEGPGGSGSLLFWRPASPRRDDDNEILSRVRRQPVLDAFLAEAGRETLAVPALLAAVAERTGIDLATLTPFFQQLLDRGVLLAELEPPYQSRRPLAWVASKLRSAGGSASWLAAVESFEEDVAALPSLAAEERLPAYDALEARFATFPRQRPLKSDELFRLDAASGLQVTLPARVWTDLEAPLRRYVRLFAGFYPERAFRAAWADRFLTRHPADTDVPLLDLYHGLFEPEARERPAAFPPPPPGVDAAARVLDRARELFADRASEAQATGTPEVALSEADWEHLLGDLPEPVWTAGALLQVAARSPEEISAGRYRLALNALFGAGIALARFAHLHDGDDPQGPVAREVARSWQPIARPGAILAEVTYNHLGRTANAGLRPTLYRHEIELPGERASPGAEVLPLTDLTVRWDRDAERFVLRWASRGLEVVPVISSGISPEGFVSFLVEIGRQGLQPLSYFPGFEVPGVWRWPRFVCGRLVLFRRRWVFPPGEAPVPPDEAGDPEAAARKFFLHTLRWRRANGLPRHVFLHTSADPKPYYADLDSPLSVDLLRRSLLRAPDRLLTLHVVEMLPGPDDGLWVRDRAGRYAAEFLLHLDGPDAAGQLP